LEAVRRGSGARCVSHGGSAPWWDSGCWRMHACNTVAGQWVLAHACLQHRGGTVGAGSCMLATPCLNTAAVRLGGCIVRALICRLGGSAAWLLHRNDVCERRFVPQVHPNQRHDDDRRSKRVRHRRTSV
jgi:hypothetical protein